MLYAASRSRKSEGCQSGLPTSGCTLTWNDAWSRASLGPMTLVNLSTVVLKSLARICCNSTTIVMSNNSHPCDCCARCARRLPPNIRARFTSERLLHAGHSSPRLPLMTSHSKQKTAFQRGRIRGSRRFLISAGIYTPTSVAEMWGATLHEITELFSVRMLPVFRWLSNSGPRARCPRKDAALEGVNFAVADDKSPCTRWPGEGGGVFRVRDNPATREQSGRWGGPHPFPRI
jgi:hypothetical protein